jgi:hypothetical protein
METSLPFILQLRRTCEAIFDVMLSAYITGLKAYYSRLQEQGKKQGSKRPSLDGWDRALQLAECALAAFREAEGQRKGGDLDSADATVDQALLALQERYKVSSSACLINYSLLFLSTGAVPAEYISDLIMKDWDDVEVRKG